MRRQAALAALLFGLASWSAPSTADVIIEINGTVFPDTDVTALGVQVFSDISGFGEIDIDGRSFDLGPSSFLISNSFIVSGVAAGAMATITVTETFDGFPVGVPVRVQTEADPSLIVGMTVDFTATVNGLDFGSLLFDDSADELVFVDDITASPLTVVHTYKVTATADLQALNFDATTRLTPVPEPTTLGLLGAGALAAGAMARRRR